MQISNLTSPSSIIYSCNVYLIQGDGSIVEDVNTLVDVGSDPSVIDRILNMPRGIGKKPIEQVILTHGHFDHTAMLELVRENFDPIVYAYSAAVAPDVLLKDGQKLRCGDREFEVIYTPSHSDDSICLYCKMDGVMFAGDTPVVIRSSEGSYGDRFVWTLERLCQKDVRTVYFGHGSSLSKGAQAVLTESLRNVRTAQAAQQSAAGVEQQTIGLDQIAVGMNDINQAAQQSAGAQQSQKAAQDLHNLAEQLKGTVAHYRIWNFKPMYGFEFTARGSLAVNSN
jgi:glyoxylase-like metal-dependent hydrolase (beta-lactamase superfamily II)